MADAALQRAYLLAEIEALEPFAFVAVVPSGAPLHVVEAGRREDGGLEVRTPGRPPGVPELPVPVRAALRERGFTSEAPDDPRQPWVRAADDAEAAVGCLLRVLGEVFGAAPDAALDLLHGDRKAEHEARLLLAAARERIEKLLVEMTGARPEQDADGDFRLALGDVHVMVAPRFVPGVRVVVRVFAVTNVGVNVAPELGLLLARLNFGLMFGRFALDAEHRAIFVDETLLGEHFDDEQLRLTVRSVASIADEWDDRLKQMFGGSTYQEMLTKGAGEKPLPDAKPGLGGYL